jgi:hypothetical protein
MAPRVGEHSGTRPTILRENAMVERNLAQHAQHFSTDLKERQGSEQRRSCFYCLVHLGSRERAIDSVGSTVAHWVVKADQDVLAFRCVINEGGGNV